MEWGPWAPTAPPRQLSVQWTGHTPDGELSDRSRLVAGLLQLFFGWYGLGHFYLGNTSTGATQLTLGIIGTLGIFVCYLGFIILIPLTIWTLIEAAMMLSGSVRDAEGRKLR